ncbi:hypothetical protein N0V83_007124 [Neocucurbitaria cava]|uniref:WH2 domain-containing protein n=1 Tax=Neocucurbitaria cava TaxID=798079 RepID=A0A9W8Y4X5_9PLEO|nr:hypothetical protein N0V83_007124 [Neocucurbitaria cava]
MPPMGRGAGGPPPPPPMPGMKAPGAKPPSGAGRGALLSDIGKGAKLKKVTVVNDRSAPIVGKGSDGPSAPPIGGAPPIPGMGRPPAPPGGLAPPVPAGGNRARSNSDTGGGDSAMASAPQLGGLFAGGMPKLRKAGGVNTGADQSNTPYLSDPETSRSSVPKPPRAAAPKPPGAPAPPIPGGRPPLNPVFGGLRDSRPSSLRTSTSSIHDFSAANTSSSTSTTTFVSPASPSTIDTASPPSAPPPPNAQADDDDDYDPYRYDSRAPSAPAPLPPKAPTNGHTPSLAEQAARNAFGRASPVAPPPPPPPGSAPTPPSSVPPSAPAPPPPPSAAPSRPTSQTPLRSMLDPSSYTLSNGGSGIKSPTSPGMATGGGGHKGKIIPIHDLRWRFQDEGQFPRPREFTGGMKRYRAGRGSSVPLDFSAYE